MNIFSSYRFHAGLITGWRKVRMNERKEKKRTKNAELKEADAYIK